MEPLDRALEILRDAQGAGGLSSHGPMAAESLVFLGHAERAPGFARRYREENLEPYALGRALAPSEWRGARGDASRLGDFVALYDAELERSAWSDVARRWLPELVPAIGCGAAHGAIRTAHALRSLESRETPQRRHELAEALGLWSADYEVLDATGDAGDGSLRPAEALQRVPAWPEESQRQESPFISHQVRMGSRAPEYGALVASVGLGAAPLAFLDELGEAAARLYLANASRARALEFVHGVTAVTATRGLLPYLDAAATRRALRAAWEFVAALHLACGGGEAPAESADPGESALDGLVARAVATDAPHAIKFAQACVVEHAVHPKPVWRAALADAVVRFEALAEKLGLRL